VTHPRIIDDEESWPTGDDAVACFAERLAGRADTREWIEAQVARLRTKMEEGKADIARLEALIGQLESSPLRVKENRP